MKSKLMAIVLVAGGSGLIATAQTRYQDPHYGGGSQSRAFAYGRSADGLINRVIADLNRAATRGYLDGRERRQLEGATGNLQEFQARWVRGKFDTGKLDRAIENLAHLADADRRGRDRDLFVRVLQDLRQFRAIRGRY
jgi:hypothetical protein